MEQATPTPQAPKKSSLSVFVAIVATLAVVGGIAYEAYQQKKDSFIEKEGQLQQEVADLQEKAGTLEQEKQSIFGQVEDLKKQLADFAAKFTSTSSASSTIDFCTASATVSEVGREEYPINAEKYSDGGLLGQLFTADDCSATRTEKIYGVKGANYSAKPSVSLKENPSAELRKALKEIGFKEAASCDKTKPEECKEWSLNIVVPLKEILKLKPYGNLFQPATK